MPQSLNPVKALRRLRLSLQKRALFRRFGQSWTQNAEGFSTRSYQTYQDYLEHQKAKLALHQFGDYDARFHQALSARLAATGIAWPGRTVLCLAARLGTEVRAFRDAGSFAVGIDLNPGPQNAHVLYGDFHALQFPNGSVDCVFTNSLDHAFDLGRIATEVRRVLKPDGLFLVEALRGQREGAEPGFFESFWWSSIDELVAIFAQAGFQLTQRTSIEYPWAGEALHLRPVAAQPG